MIKKLLAPIVLALLAIAIIVLATLFKIMHWMFASELLIAGMILLVIAIVILILKLVKHSRN